MSDADADPDVTELLTDLTRSLQELQTEIEPDRRLRPPTPGQLSRFTSEVAIPGLILILETNIRVLKLLQRAIRLADGTETGGNGSVSKTRERAEKLSRTTLSQLESTLSEVQSAVEDRPDNEETERLLSEARNLRDQIQEELQTRNEQDGTTAETDETDEPTDPVDIDVEAELKTIKDNLEDVEDGTNGDDPEDTDDDEPTDPSDDSSPTDGD